MESEQLIFHLNFALKPKLKASNETSSQKIRSLLRMSEAILSHIHTDDKLSSFFESVLKVETLCKFIERHVSDKSPSSG